MKPSNGVKFAKEFLGYVIQH